jgi:hypothetical protein
LEEYKIKNLGGPCIEEHEIGFLPVIIETEGREVSSILEAESWAAVDLL